MDQVDVVGPEAAQAIVNDLLVTLDGSAQREMTDRRAEFRREEDFAARLAIERTTHGELAAFRGIVRSRVDVVDPAVEGGTHELPVVLPKPTRAEDGIRDGPIRSTESAVGLDASALPGVVPGRVSLYDPLVRIDLALDVEPTRAALSDSQQGVADRTDEARRESSHSDCRPRQELSATVGGGRCRATTDEERDETNRRQCEGRSGDSPHRLGGRRREDVLEPNAPRKETRVEWVRPRARLVCRDVSRIAGNGRAGQV